MNLGLISGVSPTMNSLKDSLTYHLLNAYSVRNGGEINSHTTPSHRNELFQGFCALLVWGSETEGLSSWAGLKLKGEAAERKGNGERRSWIFGQESESISKDFCSSLFVKATALHTQAIVLLPSLHIHYSTHPSMWASAVRPATHLIITLYDANMKL